MQNDLFNNIAFIGGIHGVGKSTVCKQLCLNRKVHYLSASDLLKWAEINEDARNKKVVDIPLTQDRLIDGLHHAVEKDTFYLLDGHYCLLNSAMEIVRVPEATFKKINPIALYLIWGDAQEIKAKLEERDQRPYDLRLLEEMQRTETAYASELAISLKLNLHTANVANFSNIKNSINQITIKYERLTGY